jgi:hypothetical protein
MPYNLTEVANVTSYLEFTQNVNTHLMQGWLGVMFLLVISAIVFIAFIQSTNNPRKSLAATSFIAFGISILFRAIDLVPDLAIFLTLIGAAFGVAFMRKS